MLPVDRRYSGHVVGWSDRRCALFLGSLSLKRKLRLGLGNSTLVNQGSAHIGNIKPGHMFNMLENFSPQSYRIVH